MSIFEGQTSPSVNTPEPTKPEGDSYFTALVGEGKKFKDPEALAKGKAESDAFILQLQQELAALRQDVTARANLEEIIHDLKKSQQAPASNPGSPGQANEDDKTGASAPSLEDIKRLVTQELTSTQKQLQAEQNIRASEQELTKVWGNQTRSKLDARAKELGVSLEFLKSIAATTPKAFLEMVGATQQVSPLVDNVAPPRSTLSPSPSTSAPMTIGTHKTEAYYKKLRKDNPSLYWSSEVQVQEMGDAIALGEKFFV